MRIISGKYKGRYIPVRKNFKARPTTDFAKENIFNVLNNHFDFEETAVLDLFGGTGSISFEFASRGCPRIVTIEKDFKSFNFIKKTAADLGMKELKAIRADVFKFIPKCSTTFDIVFADPPYELVNLDQIPELVINSTVLNKDAWFILEHGKKHNFENNTYLIDKRTYGSVHLSIFQKKD